MSRDPLANVFTIFDKDLRLYWRSPDRLHDIDRLDARDVPWEQALPMRRTPMYAHRRNTDGLYWHSQVREFVYFESLFEKQALMWSEHHRNFDLVRAQPFRVDLAIGRSHYPDFLMRRTDGTSLVLDVRPENRIASDDREVFEATREWARDLGWDFDVYSGITSPEERNLRWLAGYRHPRNRPIAEVADRILRLLQNTDRTLRELGGALLDEKAPTLAYIYNMIWRREIVLVTPGTTMTLDSKVAVPDAL